MRYIIQRAMAQLKYHKGIYLLFMFQMIMAVILISTALDYRFSAGEYQRTAQEILGNHEVMISNLMPGEDGTLTYEDYEEIQNITGGHSILKILVGQGENSRIYSEKAPESDDIIITEWGSMPIGEAAWYPLKEMEQIDEELLWVSDIQVSYMILTDQLSHSEDVLMEIIGYLENKYPATGFTFLTPMRQIKDNLEYELTIPDYIGKLAVVGIFVMVGGFSGVVNLYMKQREKEIAVCIAAGASKKDVVMQLFLEVLVVYAFGGLIGCGIERMILGKMGFTTMFMPAGHMLTLAIISGIILLLLILVLIYPIIRIRRLPVAELLNAM